MVLDPKKVVPIYHFLGGVRDGKTITRCGRIVSWAGIVPWLQIIHLKRFARPCRSCKSA